MKTDYINSYQRKRRVKKIVYITCRDNCLQKKEIQS